MLSIITDVYFQSTEQLTLSSKNVVTRIPHLLDLVHDSIPSGYANGSSDESEKKKQGRDWKDSLDKAVGWLACRVFAGTY